jgi:hypothetical protein
MVSVKLVGSPVSSYVMVVVLPTGFVVVSGSENALYVVVVVSLSAILVEEVWFPFPS